MTASAVLVTLLQGMRNGNDLEPHWHHINHTTATTSCCNSLDTLCKSSCWRACTSIGHVARLGAITALSKWPIRQIRCSLTCHPRHYIYTSCGEAYQKRALQPSYRRCLKAVLPEISHSAHGVHATGSRCQMWASCRELRHSVDSSYMLLCSNKDVAFNMLIMRLEASAAEHQSLFHSTTDSNAAFKRQSVGSRSGRLWKKSEDAKSHGLPSQTGEKPLSLHLPVYAAMCQPLLIALPCSCLCRLASMWMS